VANEKLISKLEDMSKGVGFNLLLSPSNMFTGGFEPTSVQTVIAPVRSYSETIFVAVAVTFFEIQVLVESVTKKRQMLYYLEK
jgi:hypothetical protein